jgi:hypothetical protein
VPEARPVDGIVLTRWCLPSPWSAVPVRTTSPECVGPTKQVDPAGRHVVEIVFSGVDPPLKKHFDIDVNAGETEPLFPH